MNTADPKTRWEANKTELERLYIEQEQIYCPEFERVFTALYEIAPDQREVYNTNGWNVGADLPESINTEAINEALQAVGVVGEMAGNFKRYAEVVLQGKKLMQQNTLFNIDMEMSKRPQEQAEGWKFYPISIYAPQQFHGIIDEVITKDAERGEGLFTNNTKIAEQPDEALDEFLSVEVYNIFCSFQPFYGELRRWGITGKTLGKDFTRHLFAYLKEIADYMKANTDKPEAVKAHILEAIKRLDNVPVWGLIFQLLTLQGLLSLLENCTLQESDNGYPEAQELCNWLYFLLDDKLIHFAMTGAVYGDEDKKRLQPLCDYFYSTEIGRAVQEAIFGGDEAKGQADTAEQQTATADKPEAVNLPSELDTEQARRYFAKALENGLIDEQYKWLKGLQLAACFAREMSQKLEIGKGINADGSKRVNWRVFEELWGYKKGKLRANYNDVQKTGQQPNGSNVIDAIFG